MSYNINYQHIIFRTDHSFPSIPQEHKVELLSYVNSVSIDMGVRVLRINAYQNHVHILIDLPASMSLSEYVRKIKQTSSAAFNGNPNYPFFKGWAKGYGSFSVSHYERERIINYIKVQDEHHRVKTFSEELAEFFGKEKIAADKYWKQNWEE